mgnify:CR=1 FL=1
MTRKSTTSRKKTPPKAAYTTKVTALAKVNCRDEKHPYCGRICCIHAIKNALRLKEIAPEIPHLAWMHDHWADTVVSGEELLEDAFFLVDVGGVAIYDNAEIDLLYDSVSDTLDIVFAFELADTDRFGSMIGRSVKMRELFARLEKLGDTPELGRRGVVDEEPIELTAEKGGYFSGLAEEIGAGALYRLRLDGGDAFPDPASRFQPEGPHGPSMVVDPHGYSWHDQGWSGVTPHGQVIYELHIGTFTPEGTFAAAATRLQSLADTGITAVELMPVASFGGRFGWGYDGVLPFAPHHAYGTPDDLRAFVEELETPPGRDVPLLKATVVDSPRLPSSPVSPQPPAFQTPATTSLWHSPTTSGRRASSEITCHSSGVSSIYPIKLETGDVLRITEDDGPAKGKKYTLKLVGQSKGKDVVLATTTLTMN